MYECHHHRRVGRRASGVFFLPLDFSSLGGVIRIGPGIVPGEVFCFLLFWGKKSGHVWNVDRKHREFK